MVNKRVASIALCAGIVLTACEHETEAPASELSEPVYVYSSYSDVDYLPALFHQFTEESGIPVVVRHRSDAENVEDMKTKSGSQPADVLLTSSIHAAWLAADEGLLRPLATDFAAAGVAQHLHDADGLWVSLSIDPIVLVGQPGLSIGAGTLGYSTLASPELAGMLCLTSSAFSENRVLIAMLMTQLGDRPAELAVRTWMKNLALPPREKRSDLLNGDARRACKLSVTRLSALESSNQEVLIGEEPIYFDVEAMGIGRHATHPEGAQQLIDWLLQKPINAAHARQRHVLPVNDTGQKRLPSLILSEQHVGIAGFRDEEAIRLAERARFP